MKLCCWGLRFTEGLWEEKQRVLMILLDESCICFFLTVVTVSKEDEISYKTLNTL